MIDCPECLDSGCPPGARRFECPVCGGTRHPWPEATEVELLRNQILSWSEGYEDSESADREMARKQLARLERLIAAVRQETAEDLRLAARLFRNAANMYRQLEMDTPEDQTLHSRAVASLDSGADSLEKRASSIEAGVRQEITALARAREQIEAAARSCPHEGGSRRGGLMQAALIIEGLEANYDDSSTSTGL